MTMEETQVVVAQELPQQDTLQKPVNGGDKKEEAEHSEKPKIVPQQDTLQKPVNGGDKKEEAEDSEKPKIVEKCSSYREESNFLADLKDFEKKALTELKSKLEDAILQGNLLQKTEEQPKPEAEDDDKPKTEKEFDRDVSIWGVPLLPSKGSEGTDVVLLKFLRAREFKVGHAFEMLRKNLQWRKDMNMDSITKEEFDADLSSIAYMNGVDHEGHPVCYNIYGAFENEELYQKAFGTEEKREQFLRWRYQMMEKGIQKLDLRPGGVASLLQINDLKNSPGPSKKELRVAMKQAVAALQDNYPEFVARNIFINVPFWYYALNALLSPFLTQRTKSKFVVARPGRVTETLLKYIPAEEIPVQYGGFKREDDGEFSPEDAAVSELVIKAGSTETIEIPADESGSTLIWELMVVGWEVNYKEEFVPQDEGSYAVIVHKSKKMGAQEGPVVRNSFRTNEPGKLVITIDNSSSKKKRLLYRHKTAK